MPKISTSLAIALAAHILLIIVFTFLVDKRSSPFILDTKNVINVQFGSSAGGASPKKTGLNSNALPAASLNATPTLMNNSQNTSALGHPDAGRDESGSGSGSGVAGGSNIYDFDNSAVSYRAPTYPKLAIKRELQGSLKVKVKVSSEGKPINIEMLKSSGHELLDKAAFEAVPYWQFQPKEFPYFVEKTIIFQLKN